MNPSNFIKVVLYNSTGTRLPYETLVAHDDFPTCGKAKNAARKLAENGFTKAVYFLFSLPKSEGID